MKDEEVKDAVKKAYSEIARTEPQSCCSCCGDGAVCAPAAYTAQDLERVPEEAIMGLGCGNPTAVAGLKEGEVVLDLGSGAGIDAFLAANSVGPKGKVIGVDMTREMVDRAAGLARANGYQNIDFRLGEIENVPVENSAVDVVISNCVVNLSPDKAGVFREAYRVLRPQGRLIVSDVVSEKTLPAALRQDLDAWAACVGGALKREEYLAAIEQAGFTDLRVTSEREFYVETGPDQEMARLMSITVEAHKVDG